MNSNKILDFLLEKLKPETVSRYVDDPVSEIQVGCSSAVYHEFIAFIIRTTEQLFDRYGKVASQSELFAQARSWLNRYYAKGKSNGYDLALLDFVDGVLNVEDGIIHTLSFGAKEQMRKLYIDSVLSTTVSVLSWAQQCELVQAIKVRFADELPEPLLSRPDWCLVDSMEGLVLMCAGLETPFCLNYFE